jgi:hypothetical protein
MKKNIFLIILFLLIIKINTEKYGRIIKSNANLREKKIEHNFRYNFDINQNTQVLYNECVKVLIEDGDWIKISSLLQTRLINGKLPFIPYEGFFHSF